MNDFNQKVFDLLSGDADIVEQYIKDPIFKSCIDSIAAGMKPVTVLSVICKHHQQAFQSLITAVQSAPSLGKINDSDES